MASGLTTQLSVSEQNYLVDGCADNCRLDGREREEIRPYTIITSSEVSSTDESSSSSTSYPPLVLSNGSARLISSAGSACTHILCSVKVEVNTPSQARPNQGSVLIHVEDTLATTASIVSRKKSQEDRNNLEAILTELLASNLLDLEALCIIPYHYAFTVNIDVEILSGTAGNIIDGCSHAMRAALQHTLLPKVAPSSSSSKTLEQPKGSSSADLILESDITQATVPVGIEQSVVVVTVTVCQRAISNSYLLLLDASLEEEACSFCQVHVAIDDSTASSSGNGEPTICALRKSGHGSLPWALLPDITALAIQAVSKAKASYRVASSSHSSQQQQNLLQGQLNIQ